MPHFRLAWLSVSSTLRGWIWLRRQGVVQFGNLALNPLQRLGEEIEAMAQVPTVYIAQAIGFGKIVVEIVLGRL